MLRQCIEPKHSLFCLPKCSDAMHVGYHRLLLSVFVKISNPESIPVSHRPGRPTITPLAEINVSFIACNFDWHPFFLSVGLFAVSCVKRNFGDVVTKSVTNRKNRPLQPAQPHFCISRCRYFCLISHHRSANSLNFPLLSAGRGVKTTNTRRSRSGLMTQPSGDVLSFF